MTQQNQCMLNTKQKQKQNKINMKILPNKENYIVNIVCDRPEQILSF